MWNTRKITISDHCCIYSLHIYSMSGHNVGLLEEASFTFVIGIQWGNWNIQLSCNVCVMWIRGQGGYL